MATIEDGIYKLASLQSATQVLNVPGGSTSQGAKLEIYMDVDAYNQRKWYIQESGTYITIRNVKSNMMVDVWGAKAVDKRDIIQYPYNGTSAQLWFCETSGVNVTVNNVLYVPVILKTKCNTNYTLDRASNAYSNSTRVWLYKNNGTDAQKWVLLKDTRYQDCAVPTNVGMSTTKTSAASTTLSCQKASTTFYPCWKCANGTTWQVRWRWRGRITGTDSMSGWSPWYSNSNNAAVSNAVCTDEGWGDAWTYNVSAEPASSLFHSTQGIAINIDQGTYDKKEVQLEVRQFLSNNTTLNGIDVSSHGASCTASINCVYRPIIECDEIIFSADGLTVPIDSDFMRNGNTVTIKSITVDGKTLVSNFTRKDYDYQGDAIDIPIDQLEFIPDDGAAAKLQVLFGTIDKAWTYNLTPTITYTASHGLSINPSFTNADGWIELATVDVYDDVHCWILVENDGRITFSECDKDSDGKFIIIPPLGIEYRVFFTAVSGDSWGTYSVLRPALRTCRYVLFNYDTEYCALPWNAKIDWGLERDTEIVQTQGRDFESVYFGDGSSRQITITGDLLLDDGIPNTDFIDFEKLSVANYAIVRYPYGERFDVAIEKVSFSAEHSRYRGVTITCREVS